VGASGSWYFKEKLAKASCCCPYFKPLDDKFVEQAVTSTNSVSLNEVIQVYLTTVLKLNETWRLFDITPSQVTPLGFLYFYTEPCVGQYHVCIMHLSIARTTAVESFLFVSSNV
jgi:hypothetical protein